MPLGTHGLQDSTIIPMRQSPTALNMDVMVLIMAHLDWMSDLLAVMRTCLAHTDISRSLRRNCTACGSRFLARCAFQPPQH